MGEVVRFALLGLGVGALYAFASQGLIVIYRGTGVLNFSLGATAIAGVFMQWELQYEQGWPFLPAALVGVLLSAFLGVWTHWWVMKPLRRASSLVRVIATLGVLISVQAGVVIRYGSQPRQVDSPVTRPARIMHRSDLRCTERFRTPCIQSRVTLSPRPEHFF